MSSVYTSAEYFVAFVSVSVGYVHPGPLELVLVSMESSISVHAILKLLMNVMASVSILLWVIRDSMLDDQYVFQLLGSIDVEFVQLHVTLRVETDYQMKLVIGSDFW